MFIRKLFNYSIFNSIHSQRKNNVAQATAELAIAGTIMMLIFATLLRYGQIYNEKQATQMYAFRKALELTKRRHEGNFMGSGGRKQFASVNVNVMNTMYPVNVGGSVQEPTVADGSAAIYAEVNGAKWGNEDGAEDLGDVGASVYQIGSKMMANDEYIQPAYIKTKRRIREDKMPKTFWGALADIFDGANDKEDYITYEPLPYWEQEQSTAMTHNSQYETLESQDNAGYGQLATTRTVTETKFIPQPYSKIREWSKDESGVEDVIEIYGVEGYPGGPQDMVVTTDQTFTKARAWESDKE